jgi:hypothetical protein
MICPAIVKQKLIVLYLAWKGMNATVISQYEFTKLGLSAVSYPRVSGISRETPFAHKTLLAQEPTVELDHPLLI